MFRTTISTLIFIALSSYRLEAQPPQQQLGNINQKINELNVLQLEIKHQLDSLTHQANKLRLLVAGLPSDTYLEHLAYFFEYSEQHEQSRWVAHILSPRIATGKVSRSNDFRPDDLVTTGTATAEDFFDTTIDFIKNPMAKGYGYDRGHLAPSADFNWSAQALSESYFYSNMSPMTEELNRGIWAELEGSIRKYSIENNRDLLIVTGPVLSDSLLTIPESPNHIAIPKQFYKIVYDPESKVSISFLLPNASLFEPLINYAISIDSLESITGLNFFSNIDESIEASFDASLWLDQASLVNVAPIPFDQLNAGQWNTVSAKSRIGNNKETTVCGHVVNTRESKKGNAWLYLDLNYPNHSFTVMIKKAKLSAFPFDPKVQYLDQDVCVSGKVYSLDGKPTISANEPKAISIIELP